MRVHIEPVTVVGLLREVRYRPVVDVPGYGAVAGPAMASKGVAKRAAHLIRREATFRNLRMVREVR